MPSSAMSDAWWDVGPCGTGGPPRASRCPEASAGPPVPAPGPAQLLITAIPPFNIVNVTDGWCRLTGFSAEAVFGRPVGLLHGPLTCPETLAALTIAMSLGRSLRVMLVSYTANGDVAALTSPHHALPRPRRPRRRDRARTQARRSTSSAWPDVCFRRPTLVW